jgi:hypothetical protein
MECVANRVSVRVALIGKGYALVLAFFVEVGRRKLSSIHRQVTTFLNKP